MYNILYNKKNKNTELPKWYARLQTAAARGLGWPVGRLAGRHTDAAPKHSLLFRLTFRVIGHTHRLSAFHIRIVNIHTFAQ